MENVQVALGVNEDDAALNRPAPDRGAGSAVLRVPVATDTSMRPSKIAERKECQRLFMTTNPLFLRQSERTTVGDRSEQPS